MWDFAVTESHQVNVAQSLRKVLALARTQKAFGKAWRESREDWVGAHAPGYQADVPQGADPLTPPSLSALLGKLLSDDTVIVDETVTSAEYVWKHTGRTQAGTYYGSPGSSLGWGLGAALGHKLGKPRQPLVCVTGDGSFVFGVPSSLYITAARYRVPFLTVIYNNSGWAAVKMSTRRVYGEAGSAHKHNAYHHEFGPTRDLEQVAGAFGCFAAKAETAQEFEQAFQEAQAAMEEGRPAVINALLSREAPEPL
jgi:acetolactate synthase-1/2/3 large subunit